MEGYDDDDVLRKAEEYGTETWNEWEGVDDVEPTEDEIAAMREEVSSALSDEYEDAITADPVGFFVDDHGMYSLEDFFQANFVHIDIEAAAKDAVDTDGVAHFLNRYDGNEYEFGDSHWYRTN
jgi:hypothetical protein